MSASEEEKKTVTSQSRKKNKSYFAKPEEKQKLTSQKRKQKKTYFIKTETNKKLLHKNGNIFFLFCQNESKKLVVVLVARHLCLNSSWSRAKP